MGMIEHKSQGGAGYVTIGGFNKQGEKNPDSIEGYYLGRKEGPNTFEPGKIKVSYMLNVNGKVVEVNGSANLNIQMKDWEVGAQAATNGTVFGMRVRIEFTGFGPSKKGSPTKLYRISSDPDDVNTESPGAAAPVNATTGATATGGSFQGNGFAGGTAAQLLANAKRGAEQEKIEKMLSATKTKVKN